MIGKCKTCKTVYMSVLIGKQWFNISENNMLKERISRPKCCCPKCHNEMEQEWIRV